MKHHDTTCKLLNCIARLFLAVTVLLHFQQAFSQQPNFNVTPNGILDEVFDQRGVKHNLSDLLIKKESVSHRTVLVNCSSNSIFNLYFEPGCGMEDTNNGIHNARRAVVCKVFQDLSDFLTPSGAPLQATSATKVNIWVRNINNVFTNPNGVLGLASGYYCLPNNLTNGGIVDNEIWKTIHTGSDSYINATVPLTVVGGGSNQSGFFYHGMITFNFNDTATPAIPNTPTIAWNTNLNTTSISNTQFDLYSAVLHEVTHALGFHTLIDGNGTSVLGTNHRYFSRYDTFLQSNTTNLLSTSSCSSMYNNVFNSGLNTSVLHPNTSTCTPDFTNCSNAIHFAGTNNTVPVYTPNCYSDLSSLSHFEDTHYPGCNTNNPIYGDDNYFLMCNAGNSGVIRRYLKQEERNALCDIGYNVKNSYGVSGAYINGTATSYNYGGPASCGGIVVAGVNDGINNAGNPVYIGNVSTNINISSILLNDINATGFECLQDLSETVAFPSSITVVPGTITFNSALAGLHLLRYVPTNGSQKGNITYVYVFVQPVLANPACNAAPELCNLVYNGDFEENNAYMTVAANNGFNRLCGWYGVGNESPQYMFTHTLTDYLSSMVNVPCNLYGFENDKIPGNRGYVAIRITDYNPQQWQSSSILGTTLASPLQPATTYQLSFDVSTGDFLRYRFARLQAFITSTAPANITGALIPNNILPTGILLSSPIISSNSNGWQTITMTFTTSSDPNLPAMNFLYIGGLNNFESTVGANPSSSIGNCPNSYTTNAPSTEYYIDNVSLIAAGGQLSLPESVCTNQTLPNLGTYLNTLPPGGYFSGNGVVFSNGVYSFNPAIAGAGNHTISYTFNNNNLDCLMTINDIVLVTNTTVVTPMFMFATTFCAGASTPALPTTSNNGVVGTWSPAVINNTASANYVFTPAFGQCANPVTVSVTINPAPAIVSLSPNPQTQSVCRGAVPISLQVNASGSGLTYQWYSNTVNSNTGGTAISGATSLSYTPITTSTGTKYFYVIVTGSCGTVTSTVWTVIVGLSNFSAGTLSGTQTLCKTGHSNPTTVFTATVAGGVWSSSNTAIATILSSTSTTATIRVAPGTATITYTVTSASGCTNSVTRTVTTVIPTTPTFTQFPINPATGVPDAMVICSGATPITLPTTSFNGIVGTWSPSAIDNTSSDWYLFTPNAGQCAFEFYQSVVVLSAGNFVANNDLFSVTLPSITTVTNSVLANDLYNGSSMSSVPSGLNYTLTTVGTPPSIPSGGITFNSNGTYTIQPNTTAGTYTYQYKITTSCGSSTTANVTIVVSNYVAGPTKMQFIFCYEPSFTQYNSMNSEANITLYDGITVGGFPATPANSVIHLLSTLPSGVTINADGTLLVNTTVPVNLSFYYNICAANGVCSDDIICNIVVKSPFILGTDSFIYNINGAPLGGAIFNVLTNDLRNVCNYASEGAAPTTVPLLANTLSSLTGSTITPAYFTIAANGNVVPNTSFGLIPTGNYSLFYTVCDAVAPAICANKNVWITVVNTFRTAPETTPVAMRIEEQELGVSVVPNPSSGIFAINFDAALTGNATVSVYTLLGQEVLQQDCPINSNTFVDLTKYADGMYLLQVKIGDNVVNKSIVKE